MSVEITTEGFDAILSKIESMGKSGDRLLNEAVKAGGNVILQDALPRVSKRSGKLKDGLKVSGVKKKGGTKYVLVGITKEDNSEIFYGKFLEFGASAHKIPIKKGKKKGRVVNHPGVTAKPFLAPAYESKKDEAKKCNERNIKKRIGAIMVNINDLVIETLKPLKIPVLFQRFDGDEETYITFFSYLEQNRYADDEVVGTEHYIQIDLFSKNKMSYINKEIERLLKENNFIKRSIHEIKESDCSYHTAFRFLFFTKNEED